MGKSHKLWLTKVDGGRYIITQFKPIRGRIKGTRKPEMDSPFDPLIFRGLCEYSVNRLMGSTLPALTPKRILMTIELLPDGDAS